MNPLAAALLVLLAFMSFCNHLWRERLRESEIHVKVLEQYIQENDLPVPAYPLPKGKVAFEIEVPVCQ